MSINYDFAHLELRNFAFEKPREIHQILASGCDPGLFARVWDRMVEGEGVNASPGTKIALETRQMPDGDTLVVVSLPDAKEMTDAIYVGLHFGKPSRRMFLFTKPPELRYFTLELSFDDEERPINFLCEWVLSKGGFGHQNYEVSVDPVTVDGFASAVESRLLMK